MKLKIESATFGQGVTLHDKKVEVFVSANNPLRPYQLEYDTEGQILVIGREGSDMIKIVGITNIKEMTMAKEAKKAKQG